MTVKQDEHSEESPESRPSQNNTEATPITDRLTLIVQAIRNDGWNNGFNTPDEPWIKQLEEVITSQVNQALKAQLEDLADCGEIHHSVFDYRNEALEAPPEHKEP